MQSRYYDANIGRFINADDSSMLMEEQDTEILKYNLLVYCGNSFTNYKDNDGRKRVKSKKKYDRANVKKYIDKWYNSHNPNYVNRDGKGDDCTNFVSQCLYAGGFPMNFNWRCVKNSKLMKNVKNKIIMLQWNGQMQMNYAVMFMLVCLDIKYLKYKVLMS